MNTCFTEHSRKLWTWRSPDGITKNQIDYITINRRYRNSVKDIHTSRSRPIETTTCLLETEVKLQRLKQQKSYFPKLDLKALENCKEVKEKLQR